MAPIQNGDKGHGAGKSARYNADYQDYAEREIVRIKKKLPKKGKKGKNRP
ncbi:hypothetical protein [Sediminicola luteus]|nr:hypothetical protein [Sediminicola luteus]